MFQFPGFAPLSRYLAFSQVGCPIRTCADHNLFAVPRAFSQLTTSFIASGSQGILRSLLLSFFSRDSITRLVFAFEIVEYTTIGFKKPISYILC